MSTDAQINAAIEAGKLEPPTAEAIEARYIIDTTQVAVRFDNDFEIRFPRRVFPALERANDAEVSQVSVTRSGWLLWSNLDIEYFIPQLMDGFEVSCRVAAASLGRRGGSKTSAAKVLAGRNNGKKGGRPRTRRDTLVS